MGCGEESACVSIKQRLEVQQGKPVGIVQSHPEPAFAATVHECASRRDLIEPHMPLVQP